MRTLLLFAALTMMIGCSQPVESTQESTQAGCHWRLDSPGISGDLSTTATEDCTGPTQDWFGFRIHTSDTTLNFVRVDNPVPGESIDLSMNRFGYLHTDDAGMTVSCIEWSGAATIMTAAPEDWYVRVDAECSKAQSVSVHGVVYGRTGGMGK